MYCTLSRDGALQTMSSSFTSDPYKGYQGLRNKKKKGLVEAEAEPAGENDAKEMEAIP